MGREIDELLKDRSKNEGGCGGSQYKSPGSSAKVDSYLQFSDNGSDVEYNCEVFSFIFMSVILWSQNCSDHLPKLGLEDAGLSFGSVEGIKVFNDILISMTLV